MSEQTARRLSWSNVALSVVLVASGLVLSLLALAASDGQVGPAPHQLFNPVATLTYSVVGALVASRHPRNPIGWMLSAMGFMSAVSLLALGYQMYSQSGAMNDSLPGVELAQWLNSWVWILVVMIPITFLLLLFPEGRFLSPRWRPIAWAAGLGIPAYTFAVAFHPGPLTEIGMTELNPFGIPGGAEAMNALMTVAAPLLLVGIFGSIASLVVRFRRSRGTERAQLKWLVYAVGVSMALNIVASVVAAAWPEEPVIGPVNGMEVGILSSGIMIVAIVIAVGIAIVRHRLYDIDILINRTLVYASLTALIVAIYVLIVGSLGTLLQAGGGLPLSLFATGIVAISFQPLRERLQRRVNRLMFGERDDPYAVLGRLSERLEVVVASQSVLPTIVETVAEALKLPYAAIALKEGEGLQTVAEYYTRARQLLSVWNCPRHRERLQTAAEYTRAPAPEHKPHGDMEILPLVYQAETIGQMILAPRAPGEQFSQNDRRLLETIARQAGIAAYNVRLTQDLQRSRERLVTTREEERRRLRRDLHDGLGPVLASAAFKLDAIHNLADHDPAAVRQLVADLKMQMQAALADIRRIAYDLRPPALDELGLVGAIREHIASHNQAQGVQITLEVPGSLPALPAAVEVATYRIALEAITNVSRHAGAQHCCVRLSLSDNLYLEVTDDGRGVPDIVRAGVGLTSMRERAEELGGTCAVDSIPTGGTCVFTHLPLPMDHRT